MRTTSQTCRCARRRCWASCGSARAGCCAWRVRVRPLMAPCAYAAGATAHALMHPTRLKQRCRCTAAAACRALCRPGALSAQPAGAGAGRRLHACQGGGAERLGAARRGRLRAGAVQPLLQPRGPAAGRVCRGGGGAAAVAAARPRARARRRSCGAAVACCFIITPLPVIYCVGWAPLRLRGCPARLFHDRQPGAHS